MSTETIQRIQPKTVHTLPVNVGIILEANIRKYSFMSTEELPLVRIAQVEQKNYALNHHDVILACKQSNKEIRCTVESFQSLSDVMMEHFKDVLSNDVINTPAIYSMVDSLQERTKKPKSEVLKFLGIDKNQYGKLLMATNGNNMSESAITELENLVADLSKRKSITAIQASIPQYVLEKISRMSVVKDQLRLIHFIHLDLQKKNDSRLFWMTPEQIDSVIQMIRQDATRTENKREESTVATFVDIKDIGKEKVVKETTYEDVSQESVGNKKSIKEKSKNKQPHASNITATSSTEQKARSTPPKPSKKTRQILETIPNMIVIPDQNGEPEMLIDKKNGTISKIDHSANKNIIKINPIPSKKLYSIPFDVVKFLKVEEKDCLIRHKNVSGIEALESFVRSQKDRTMKFSVFWNDQ